MKNQEQKNTKNKRLLTHYLILGACILVIAAVTLAVTLSLTLGKNNNITIDTGNDTDQTPDDELNGDNDDVEDTAGDMEFAMPVDDAVLLNDYVFYHNTTTNKYYLHTGVDFSAEAGASVYAVLDGTVESIVTGSVLNGTTITLSHENGIKTTYTYVDASSTLKAGDTVKKGDLIGTVSEATGKEYKDGAHLHFEVFLNGNNENPNDYLDIDSK